MADVRYFGHTPRSTQRKWFTKFRSGLLAALQFKEFPADVKSTYQEVAAPIEGEVDYLVLQVPYRVYPRDILSAAEITRDTQPSIEAFAPVETVISIQRTDLRFQRTVNTLRHPSTAAQYRNKNKLTIEAFRTTLPAFLCLRELIDQGKEFSLKIEEGLAVFVVFRA